MQQGTVPFPQVGTLPPAMDETGSGADRTSRLTQAHQTSVERLTGALAAIEGIRTDVSPALALCTQSLSRLVASLIAPTRVAILGEYNCGKTSVANHVLGEPLLPTSAIANTRVPVHARYDRVPRVTAETTSTSFEIDPSSTPELAAGDRLQKLVINVPLERLRQFELMDTPSTNVIDEAARWAQVCVWCTMASRAWGESERRSWSALPARCRINAVLLATHADALSNPGEIARVRARCARWLATANARVSERSSMRPARSADGGDEFEPVASTMAIWRKRPTVSVSSRARTADRIARRIARMTLRHLDPSFDRASGLPVWEEAAGRLRRTLRAKPRGDAMRHELRTPNALDAINRFDSEIAPRFPQTPQLSQKLIERASRKGTFLAAEAALDDMAAILNLVSQDVPAGFGKDGQPERMTACEALVPLLLAAD